MLDTWALLAYLDGEPAAQHVRQVLRSARRKQVVVLLSLIAYGECLYVIEREQGFHQAQRAIGIIDQLALRVMPADRPLVFEAAHVKAHYPVSYADAFSVALARRNNGCVMTGDQPSNLLSGSTSFGRSLCTVSHRMSGSTSK